MTGLDWAIVGAYALFTVVVGLWADRRGAGDDTESYFLSKRALPWWLAGASMAASAFSIDTPLYVARLTQTRGIEGNWEWWFMGVSGVFGATVMGRLWQRAGVTTDIELITLRYSGRPARALRATRALFFGLVVNPLAMSAVVVATFKVTGAALPGFVGPDGMPTGWGAWLLGGLFATTVAYAVLSGFMGVVVTDLAQFVISFVGAVVLAAYAVSWAGGLDALVAHPAVAAKTSLLPDLAGPWSLEGTAFGFAVFLGVFWWTYVNADGGGKYVQRLAGCKDEAAAEGAFWFSSITFVALRSWPWILTGLAALVLLPATPDPEASYPALMMRLPEGARGLVLASLLAAAMSTLDTQLNWGASYLTNDLVKPYLLPGRPERLYVHVARLCSVPTIALVAAFVLLTPGEALPAAAGAEAGTPRVTVLSATAFLRGVLEVSSGLGAVFLLRWLWAGLTAWGEIAAMIVAPTTAWLCGKAVWALPFAPTVLAVTAATVLAAVAVSALGPAEDEAHLRAFAARVRPPGLWRHLLPAGAGGEGRWLALRFVAGNLFLWGLTFALGGLLLGRPGLAAASALSAAGGFALDRWARGAERRRAPAPPAVQAPGPA